MKPYFIRDNVLSPEEEAKAMSEIKSLKDKFSLESLEGYKKYRLNLDSLYPQREQSYILKLIKEKVFSEDVYNGLKKTDLLLLNLIKTTSLHTTYVTSHYPNGECAWHTDSVLRGGNFNGQIINYVLYLNTGKFTGGNIRISKENVDDIPDKDVGINPIKEPRTDYIIEPKNNRLILFPTNLWHTVDKIKNDKWTGPMDGRLTINGHIGYMKSQLL